MEQIHKNILDIKNKLAAAGVDIQEMNLVLMPWIPSVGQHEFMIETHCGMTVARLISAPND